MGAIQQLTTHAILLERGGIVESARPQICVEKYLSLNNVREESLEIRTSDEGFRIVSLKFRGDLVERGFNKDLKFDLKIRNMRRRENIYFGFGVFNSLGARLTTSKLLVHSLDEGNILISVAIKDHHLPPGSYSLSLGISTKNAMIFYGENIFSFAISDEDVTDPLLVPYLSRHRDKIGAFIPAAVMNLRCVEDEDGI